MRFVHEYLWIGTARDARDIKKVLDAGIEAIVDLAIEEPPIAVTRELLYFRIPLIDGEGNCSTKVKLALDVLVKLIDEQVPTLVACGAGMSRSPAVVAMAVARHEKRDPATVLKEIAVHGPLDVQPLLWQELLRYVV
jgi:protein-tyrosine phosphatase